MNFDNYDPVASCEQCRGEFEEGVEDGYYLCLDCGCPTQSNKGEACYLARGHNDHHVFTQNELDEPSEDEIQEVLTSIGKAVK